MEGAAQDIVLQSVRPTGDETATPLTTDGQQITRDDKATGHLLQMILDAIAELEQSPNFAGFQFEVVANPETLDMQYIRLVPCDRIGDIISPRV